MRRKKEAPQLSHHLRWSLKRAAFYFSFRLCYNFFSNAKKKRRLQLKYKQKVEERWKSGWTALQLVHLTSHDKGVNPRGCPTLTTNRQSSQMVTSARCCVAQKSYFSALFISWNVISRPIVLYIGHDIIQGISHHATYNSSEPNR